MFNISIQSLSHCQLSGHNVISLLLGSQQHMAVGVDVSDKGSVEAAFKSFQKNYGEPPSLLVNSAGIAPMSPFTDTSEEEWMKVIDVNLKASIIMFVTKLYRHKRQDNAW
ncbi:hypothetical protein Pmani_025308 [Petrolisthes manimaculis]|uniref:Uncharacterized protein n=1 Tax=Petrolisthes manimaculis TaxID=1843537 RepID=A0AAE1P6Z9_9EUCA|nr:hypothetical protein Pmani_025308 [Petrolisthes manimaculis]